MATKKSLSLPRSKTPPPAPPTSKGRVKVALGKGTADGARSKTYDARVSDVIEGTAVVVQRKEKRDPFALPELPALPELNVSLPSLEMVDPIEEEASAVRVFGVDLDDSPIEERDDDHTHEDAEAARLADLHRGFRSRMEAESKRRELATDTEFWFTVVFQDRDQKDQFLRGLDVLDLGDKYIDGERLAHRLGVAVDKSVIRYNLGGADSKLAALVGIDPSYGSETPEPSARRGKRR